MLYSEEDVKKAVEAARQACIRNSNLTPWGGVAWFEATPDDFYRGVMAFARDPTIKVIFPRSQKEKESKP